MDKHEAKFILSSFRPDGADAGSPEFAEALRMAVADRELGEWLAAERAMDAGFSGALAKLSLPDDLKQAILDSLAVERGETPEPDALDAAFGDALEGLQPPPALRGEILMAMRESAPRKNRWKLAVPLAAAAGIALALVITRPDSSSDASDQIADTVPVASPVVAGAVPVAHIADEAIRSLTSPGFTLDLKDPDHEALFRFIRKHGRACPAGCVPKGLRDVPGIGCRNMVVEGKAGAIVCFRRGEDDVVHLVVFRKEDVEGCGSEGSEPRIERRGDWAVARWSEKGRVFLLMGATAPEQLGELF